MPVYSEDSPDLGDARDSSSDRLLTRARRGSRSAAEILFARYRPWLRRWARGRLPSWARGAVDTSDLVQDTLREQFARLDEFKSEQSRAMRSCLRRAIENRIRDQLRRATRRRNVALPAGQIVPSNPAAPQHQQLVDDEMWRRYLDGLQHLTARDRRLIVGRTELGYNFRQLALVERLPSPDAARMALRRALMRLSGAIQDVGRRP